MRYLMMALGGLLLAGPVAAAGTKADDPDRLICKRFQETGSLVRSQKKCFTKAEWDQIAEMERRGWEKTRDELTTRPGGS